MAEYVEPESEYTSRVFGLTTGLTGTVRFRLIDNDGTANDPLYGPATAGIIEDPSGSGAYLFRSSAVSEVAPAAEGKFARIWDSGPATELVPDEDLITLAGVAALVGGTGDLYLTADELKASLNLSGTTFADEDVDLALAAACRSIDAYRRTWYFPRTMTRYYDVDRYATEIAIDDLVSASSVTVDVDGDLSYSETWVEGTDFFFDPPNANADGQPFKRLVLRRPQVGRRFPVYQRALMIDGIFGWATTPVQVVQATKILATQLVNRRDVPFGIITAGSEMVAMARLGRIDPHVAWLLGQIPGEQRPALRSLQLG